MDIDSIQKAISTAPTGPNVQKLWKKLADIYEESSDWIKHADSLTSLYYVVKEKGNIDRASQLAENIIESYQKAGLLQDSKCQSFGAAHLKSLIEMETEAGLSTHFIHIRSVLSTLLRPILQAASDLAQASKLRLKFIDIQNWYQLCLQVTERTKEKIADVNNTQTIYEWMCFYITQLRAQTVVTYIETKANAKSVASSGSLTWIKVFEECVKILPIIRAVDMSTRSSACLFTFADVFLEAWSYLRINESDIACSVTSIEAVLSCIEFVLKVNPRHFSSNMVKCWISTEKLCLVGARPCARICIDIWVQSLENPVTTSDSSSGSTSSSKTNSLFTSTSPFLYSGVESDHLQNQLTQSKGLSAGGFKTVIPQVTLPPAYSLESSLNNLCAITLALYCAVDGLRGMTVTQYLHLAALARRQLAWSVMQFGFSNTSDISTTIQLVVAKSYVDINQIGRAQSSLLLVKPFLLSTSSSLIIDDGNAADDDGNDDDQAKKSKEETDDKRQLSFNTTELSSLLTESITSSRRQLFAFLLLVTGIEVGLASEAIIVVDSVLEKVESSALNSWLYLAKGMAMLHIAVNGQRKHLRAHGLAKPPGSFTLLHMTIPEGTADSIIRVLQLAVRALDSATESCTIKIPEISAEINTQIGVAMWLKGGRLRTEKNGCLIFLIEGAKKDPSNGNIYTFIGHYYHQVMSDFERAAQCYEKGLISNPLSSEAGYSLSKVLLTMGEANESRCINRLAQISDSTNHAVWSHRVQGRYYLHKEQFEQAISHFQKALNVQSDNATIYFDLGRCYYGTKQDISAHKAFVKAHELAPNDLHITYYLANVERKLCLLKDSIAHFNEVIAKRSDDILSLKGLADVKLLLSYQALSLGCTIEAARHVISGLGYVDRALEQLTATSLASSGSKSLLKLYGDLGSFARHCSAVEIEIAMMTLPPLQTNINTKGFLSASVISGLGSFQDLIFVSGSTRVGIMDRSVAAYRRLVDIYELEMQSNSSTETVNQLALGLCDLASSLYFRVVLMADSCGQGSGLVALTQVTKAGGLHGTTELSDVQEAQTLFMRAIRLNPSCSSAWNGLALCLKSYPTQAHLSFLRAIQIDLNPSAFANLSLLYTLHREDALAKSTLSALQSIENNPLLWINFGILFDRSEQTATSVAYSYDSYVSGLEIAKPVDALLGAAVSWLRKQDVMSAFGLVHPLTICHRLQTATITNRHLSEESIRSEVEFPLVLYVRRKPMIPQAWMILGWCLEVRQRYTQAREAYVNALKALDHITAILVDDTPITARRDMTQVRLLMTLLTSSYHRCTLLIAKPNRIEFPSTHAGKNSSAVDLLTHYSSLRKLMNPDEISDEKFDPLMTILWSSRDNKYLCIRHQDLRIALQLLDDDNSDNSINKGLAMMEAVYIQWIVSRAGGIMDDNITDSVFYQCVSICEWIRDQAQDNEVQIGNISQILSLSKHEDLFQRIVDAHCVDDASVASSLRFPLLVCTIANALCDMNRAEDAFTLLQHCLSCADSAYVYTRDLNFSLSLTRSAAAISRFKDQFLHASAGLDICRSILCTSSSISEESGFDDQLSRQLMYDVKFVARSGLELACAVVRAIEQLPKDASVTSADMITVDVDSLQQLKLNTIRLKAIDDGEGAEEECDKEGGASIELDESIDSPSMENNVNQPVSTTDAEIINPVNDSTVDLSVSSHKELLRSFHLYPSAEFGVLKLLFIES